VVLRNQMVQQFGGAQQNMDFASILPDDMFRAQAERRVKLGLILNDIIVREAIKPDAARVRTAVEEIASTYEDPQEVIGWYYGNKQQLQGVESMVLEEQVVEKLLEQATVSDKACSYEEVLKPEQPEGAPA
jgi:trigger factor